MNKTITIGTYKTKQALLKALEKECKVSSWAKEILAKTELSKKKQTIELEIKSVAELGFPNGATKEQIYTKAKEMGLELCPAEVGPYLRLQYKDQPMNDWFLVGMEPISDSGGGLGVFSLVRDGGEVWLDGSCGSPGSFWLADFRWVFMKKNESVYPNALSSPKEAAEKVLARIEEVDTCWIWTGATSKGYGAVKYQNKQFTAHRVVYEILVCKIPKGLVLDHLCRNRACVNPDHLAIVTNQENVKRGWANGRKWKPRNNERIAKTL